MSSEFREESDGGSGSDVVVQILQWRKRAYRKTDKEREEGEGEGESQYLS